MTSYTTLVNVDAETALKVSQFVSKLLPAAEQDSFLTECKTLIDSTKAGDLIEKILEHRDTIFNTLTDDDGMISVSMTCYHRSATAWPSLIAYLTSLYHKSIPVFRY